ncbi:hypothetical protein AFAEC_1978 [Aliarcobacter faecis]|uniref:hypothetical protein n=1 Tax=Aliarcobacter faecis TaxID=1564138 RepID=UPI00047AB079|nr:hypothetical protein [Aliarcobacter faecis]QKF74129.1 hypothetical protein AFAEC_1978 [Aliarcobacter faecis]
MLLNYICRARILNIYIYGTPSFKKEIHKTLIDSNIKLKLGVNNLIKEVESLSALKEIIAQNPKEIFLIDDSKIIKKNSFAKKVKFLTPKDAIEEEFLLNSGIADLSVDSLEEIPKYILKKYEQEKAINEIQEKEAQEFETPIIKQEIILDDDNFFLNTVEEISQKEEEPLDDELSELLIKNSEDTLNEDLDSSIAELENLFVDDDKIGSVYDTNVVDFNDNFGLNNISFDYDDSTIINDSNISLDDEELLKSLMSGPNEDLEDSFENDIEKSSENLDFIDTLLKTEEEESLKKENNNEKVDIEKELELNLLLSKIEETKQLETKPIKEDKIIIKEEPIKGVQMANNDFSELDLIDEKDLLEALNLEQTKEQNSFTNQTKSSVEVINNTNSNEIININSSNIDDLAKLFSKILNNKTLEITIKIKD